MSHNMPIVRKDTEYERFLSAVENNQIPAEWELLADALGVHRNTIGQWKKRPEFQEARVKGIEHAINMMEHSGKRDWKMWREKIAMLTNEKKPDVQVNMQVNYLDYVERDTSAVAETSNKRPTQV